MSAMKSPLVAATATLVLLAGCADYNDPQPGPLPSPNASTTLPPAGTSSGGGDAASGTPKSAADLTIGFGSLGPAKIGMSKDEAMKTGVFRTGNPAPVDGCPEPPLLWKQEFEGVDVLTKENGTITSLGVKGNGPKTAAGVGVGSTLAEVEEAYGADLSEPAEAGYGQTGAFAGKGDRWIGFLFDATASDVKDDTKVLFVETTQGAKPDLMRDGC